jgi:hypothetical protein
MRLLPSAPSRCGWGEVPRRSPASSPATVPHAVGIEPRRRTPWPASADGATVLDEPTRRDRYLNSAKTGRRPTSGGQRCVSELRHISGRRIVYLTGPRWARACRHTHKKYESTYGNPAPESGEPGGHDHTGYDARSVVPVRSTVSPAIVFRPDHPSPSTRGIRLRRVSVSPGRSG